ncbi:ATP-dependent exoDNAse (exonuclease V) beta subunit [Halanaerobium saccharolyticum]|uniref:DNA 3'-5' helicase n=1 Tax=Halanaerobium saccharolyticum TaxID=43595 RepID=A0A4R7ZD57_9FIRM|nr:UvrD-helicase domain-containing protein [Halanaerobium saccharolyticum]RAK10522.1 ATP-dependent exoDNAse (exonuclease V) beta subunit [Halanaerobium saccharolyticum]TDW06721.1 ATP-dependent exoDNAse (exonuclease V) beta subunit [Halanaerobium saccharolyticum]TDX62356.1 ATP-dependent exoDNAse (exonuclease V) beta subunit [Halanaerobium saccharolyticum]
MKKVIKASAGTGKTYRLSLEYLAALLKDIDFSEIIVMTFTKKATAEIKNRILQHLRAIITDSSEKENIINSLKKIYPGLKIEKEKLAKIYQKMILNDEDIKIYTIDAFTNQIFSRGIAPFLELYNYQIIDESQNEEIIEELLKIILNNEKYYKQLQGFLEGNTARDLEPYLNFIKEIVNNAWKFILLESTDKEKLPQADIVKLFEDSYQTLKEVAELRGENFSASYFVKDGRPFFEQYPELKTEAKKKEFLYRRRNYLLNDSYWSGNKLRAKKTKELKTKLEFEYDLFRKKLAVEVFNQEVIPAEKEIIDFAELVLSIYEKLKFKSGKFTHADLSNYTFKYLKNKEIGLIEDGKATDYLLDLLGGEYKALYIDEFQDTSVLQWKILQPLIKGAEDFIAVGDEKQSIYGWRGGEKNLFASLAEIIDAESERLERCYRSDQNIINLLNDFFSGAEVDWEYHPVEADSKAEGLSSIVYGGSSAHYNTKTKKFAGLAAEKQKEIEKLNSQIKGDLPAEIAADIKKRYAADYGQVSVLARTAKELNLIAESLEAEGVPYILENRNSLLDAPLPAALFNFLYFAAYRDFYSLLKFLRSDLIRLSQQKLKLILKNKSEIKKYFNSSEAETLSVFKKEEDLNRLLTEIKKTVNLEYQELLNYLYQKTEVINLAAENSLTLKNIYSFFEILNSFSSLKRLINYLTEYRDSEELKQNKVENKEAVTLMTIHQSKGLSLPVEYFYWNPGRRGGNEGEGINFYLDFDDNYDNLNEYLFIKNEYLSILDWLDYDFKEKNEKKEEMEEINNLYVALSRAENDLHLYVEAPRKIKPDSDLMWSGSSYDYYEKMLLNAVEADNLLGLLQSEIRGQSRKVKAQVQASDYKLAELNKYLKQKADSFAGPEAEDKKYKFFQKQASGLKISETKVKGLALHYYLENIKYNQDSEKESARKLLKSKYGNLLGIEKIEAVIKEADQFISSHSEIFAEEYQVFNEYLLKENTESGEKQYRIDRLLVDQQNRKVKIIDYKSGSYRDPAQLKKYQELLEKKLEAGWEIESQFMDI